MVAILPACRNSFGWCRSSLKFVMWRGVGSILVDNRFKYCCDRSRVAGPQHGRQCRKAFHVMPHDYLHGQTFDTQLSAELVQDLPFAARFYTACYPGMACDSTNQVKPSYGPHAEQGQLCWQNKK